MDRKIRVVHTDALLKLSKELARHCHPRKRPSYYLEKARDFLPDGSEQDVVDLADFVWSEVECRKIDAEYDLLKNTVLYEMKRY